MKITLDLTQREADELLRMDLVGADSEDRPVWYEGRSSIAWVLDSAQFKLRQAILASQQA